MEPNRPPQGATPVQTDERRHLSVLFSDLCGSTQLGHAADPEVLDEVLQHVKDAAFEVIARYDGTVIQFHGDGVLAGFGYPTPREDDVRRATPPAPRAPPPCARPTAPPSAPTRRGPRLALSFATPPPPTTAGEMVGI